ncbi:MAG: ankyrin repeat domain-containing protein [Bacteroidetes bacterium]|nr:MAG: ankyrin repeat domain-containing protein [Bacteroidota bacterium]
MFKAFRQYRQKRQLLRSLGSIDEAALFAAVEQNKPTWVRLLAEQGVNVNHCNAGGLSPLMMAAAAGNSQMVSLLTQLGAALNLQDHQGETALMKAAVQGHQEVVNLLLQAQAEVDIRDHQGRTALIKAIKAGNTGIVRSLLQAQADPNIIDGEGKHVLEHAAFSPSLCRLLEEAGAQKPAARQENLQQKLGQLLSLKYPDFAQWPEKLPQGPWNEQQLALLRETLHLLDFFLNPEKMEEIPEEELTQRLEYARLLLKIFQQVRDSGIQLSSILTTLYQESQASGDHPQRFMQSSLQFLEELNELLAQLVEKTEASLVNNA